MGQFVSITIACLAGLFTWGLASTILAASQSALGPAGKLEALIFFAPIVGLAAPLALRTFSKQGIASGLWVVALAPFLGAINFVLFLLFAVSSDAASDDWPSALLLSALWLIPLIGWLRPAYFRAAAAGTESMPLGGRSPSPAHLNRVSSPYIKALADRGYDVCTESNQHWRVVAPGSRVIQHVRSLEELEALASSLAACDEA